MKKTSNINQAEKRTSKNSPLGGWGAILLWLRICRPQTLFASLVPVLVGLYIAGEHILIDGLTAVITTVCALSLQILSNLINDYYDYVRGTDKAGRAGFKRALAEGEVSKRAMLIACLIAASIACILGLYLIYIGTWVILGIGLSALLFAWLYTATSHSLSYLGIADIFVFLYYGVIASCGTVYLQYCALAKEATCYAGPSIMSSLYEGGLHSPLMQAFFAGGVCGFISMCVLLINNLRDVDDDRKVGKRTLPVRFGKRFCEGMMLVIICLMPVFAYLAYDWSLSMLIIIPALLLWTKVLKAKGAEYNKCLLSTGLMNLLYYVLIIINRILMY